MKRLIGIAMFLVLAGSAFGLEIFGIKATSDLNSVLIEWQTKQEVCGAIIVLDAELIAEETTPTTSHSILLEGLIEDTTYEIIIRDTTDEPLQELDYKIKTCSYLTRPMTREMGIIKKMIGIDPEYYFECLNDISVLSLSSDQKMRLCIVLYNMYFEHREDNERLVREMLYAIKNKNLSDFEPTAADFTNEEKLNIVEVFLAKGKQKLISKKKAAIADLQTELAILQSEDVLPEIK